jgi:hypothetical protein
MVLAATWPIVKAASARRLDEQCMFDREEFQVVGRRRLYRLVQWRNLQGWDAADQAKAQNSVEVDAVLLHLATE